MSFLRLEASVDMQEDRGHVRVTAEGQRGQMKPPSPGREGLGHRKQGSANLDAGPHTEYSSLWDSSPVLDV